MKRIVKKEAKREFKEALEIDEFLRKLWINYQHFKKDRFLKTLADDIKIYLEEAHNEI